MTGPRTDALRAARDTAADAALARYDFGDWRIEADSRRWQSDEPDRWYCVVTASDPASGAPRRAQFNVWFAPGTASVTDVYEGDWH